MLVPSCPTMHRARPTLLLALGLLLHLADAQTVCLWAAVASDSCAGSSSQSQNKLFTSGCVNDGGCVWESGGVTGVRCVCTLSVTE
ncbi:hypothetical protein KUCAC02_000184, partial [Chaenocephalus aceratus]